MSRTTAVSRRRSWGPRSRPWAVCGSTSGDGGLRTDAGIDRKAQLARAIMSEAHSSKVPVLVTGGAGYIGSHAVLALKDAGWSVAVIDDLSNGSREVVPDDVPFFEGDIAD